MKRILSISWVVAALACGSVKDKQACSVSTQCPAGQYCAHAGGESRCWADAVAPVVGTVTASCAATPCLRDGVLHVQATITDDAEVLDASVALDLPGGSAVPMAPSGGSWVADVPLKTFGFPSFSRDVVATVTARDGARNASAGVSAGAVGVTRLRWTYDAGAPITSPAVMSDGTAVVGVSASSGQVLAVGADGAKKWSVNVGGTAFVTAAPAIGERAIWVGSEDFSLYAVELEGRAVMAGVGANASGAIRGSVAVLPGAAKEWGIVASSTGFVGAASTAPGEDALVGPTSPFSVGPIVGSDGRVFAATAALSATLQAYGLNTTAVVLTQEWSTNVGLNVSAPLAMDAAGNILSGTLGGTLDKTVPGVSSGVVTPIASLPGAITDSPVVLANGDIVVGDDSGVLHRYTPAGTQVWAAEPNLGAAIHGPIVLASGDAAFVVPTAIGKILARGSDGSDVWSTTLDPGNALRAANIYTPPGQTSNVMSTAYLASSSGKLFAVIVDGELDASAPWPKAFHDPRNTNRAGPQP